MVPQRRINTGYWEVHNIKMRLQRFISWLLETTNFKDVVKDEAIVNVLRVCLYALGIWSLLNTGFIYSYIAGSFTIAHSTVMVSYDLEGGRAW